MATTTVFIGDTFTFHGEFRDTANVPVDTDDSSASVTIYENESLSVVIEDTATRQSEGIFEYEWTVPEGDGIVYILEMKGTINGFPQLNRMKAKARFRP